jgi:anti-sigma regulatory factor (Ser/Thr protein kinase)
METEPSSQLVIPAKLEQLQNLEQWVRGVAAEFILPAAMVQRIDLCLTELITNVISYGYPDGILGTVRIRLWRQPEQIVIRIDDDGAHFDPTSFEAPGLPGTLADAHGSGRGIRLVRHFADELHHLAGPSGNELTLVFHSSHGSAG